MNSQWQALIQWIDRELSGIYHLQEPLSSFEFLTVGGSQRGEVLTFQEEDSFFIEISISEQIHQKLLEAFPLTSLSWSNLDAFCVLVEEISHFHLLTQRAQLGLQTTKLELEFQGELDKYLIASSLLAAQTGKSHHRQLLLAFYDQAQIDSNEASRYHEASRYAEQLIRRYSSDSGQSSHWLSMLRQLYGMSWREKLSLLSTTYPYQRAS